MSLRHRNIWAVGTGLLFALMACTGSGGAQDGVRPAPAAPQGQEGKKPNILILWGDDIGEFNISAYNLGQMGYKTPNIDRIARQGTLFMDWYGQQRPQPAARSQGRGRVAAEGVHLLD